MKKRLKQTTARPAVALSAHLSCSPSPSPSRSPSLTLAAATRTGSRHASGMAPSPQGRRVLRRSTASASSTRISKTSSGVYPSCSNCSCSFALSMTFTCADEPPSPCLVVAAPRTGRIEVVPLELNERSGVDAPTTKAPSCSDAGHQTTPTSSAETTQIAPRKRLLESLQVRRSAEPWKAAHARGSKIERALSSIASECARARRQMRAGRALAQQK
mmetsp:Transcript_62943/g.165096  ORF Transcript_62943/g.165096 Transcript_62943/m.165096 type:complete len:216 (+) Transcript_62943:117-764(+)